MALRAPFENEVAQTMQEFRAELNAITAHIKTVPTDVQLRHGAMTFAINANMGQIYNSDGKAGTDAAKLVESAKAIEAYLKGNETTAVNKWPIKITEEAKGTQS